MVTAWMLGLAAIGVSIGTVFLFSTPPMDRGADWPGRHRGRRPTLPKGPRHRSGRWRRRPPAGTL